MPVRVTATAAARRSWARAVVAAGEGQAPIDVVAAVVVSVAEAMVARPIDHLAASGLDGDERVRAKTLADRLPDPDQGWADPWLPGLVHEQAVGAAERSARGAWYTPESVVRGLVRLATPVDRPPATVVDPTCGGGAFLLAALDRYRELGLDPDEALSRVGGTDIDPVAVRTTRWSIALWAMANSAFDGGEALASGIGVSEADALAAPAPDGRDEGPAGSEGRLVLGNPPFATPLRRGRLGPEAEAYRADNDDLLGPYADLAAIHLLSALRSVGPGSTVAMVQPQSVLAGRDTAALRLHCHDDAPLYALWASRQSVFDAGVRACAVVLRPGAEPAEVVALAAGPEVEPVVRVDPDPAGPGRWGVHAARALGAPALPPSLAGKKSGRLSELVTATAGFRDEYYGLVGACREWEGSDGSEPNRLVTVGSIDPLTEGWGRADCRLGGRSWRRPTVDLDDLAPRIRGWVDQRLVPKVVLATQSRVLEPVVDRRGRLVPVTPLVSVEADAEVLDQVAAVLLAPPVVAWAWQRWFGAALSVDALKLAARQVGELPLPGDSRAWDEAAALVAEMDGAGPAGAAEAAAEVAAIMNRAYGAGDEVLAWWWERAPGRGSIG